jgi:hypothetical protein
MSGQLADSHGSHSPCRQSTLARVSSSPAARAWPTPFRTAAIAAAGWLMGLAIPVLVLVLSKVCGEKYRAGQRPVAWLAGGAGVALLCLSVWHCSQSVALLTGSPVALAVPLAIAVDVGLVACEVALITEPRS